MTEEDVDAVPAAEELPVVVRQGVGVAPGAAGVVVVGVLRLSHAGPA